MYVMGETNTSRDRDRETDLTVRTRKDEPSDNEFGLRSRSIVKKVHLEPTQSTGRGFRYVGIRMDSLGHSVYDKR